MRLNKSKSRFAN